MFMRSKSPSLKAGSGNNSRPSSKDGSKKNIWSSMLDSAASGKHLPEKNLLILGGTPEAQREFLAIFSANGPEPSLQNTRRRRRTPPIANQFALGYTYQDVLDADQEDTLARVSVYLLAEPSLTFSPLVKPLLTPQSIPETLVVILLDWSEPWAWVRRLREWIRFLRCILISLDDETKMVMEQTMAEWRDRKRGLDPNSTGIGALSSSGGPVTIPLGPGEWDEAIGIPMCVVCQGADNIEKLEKEYGWHEEEFDFILQFMRTILLKHGSSLIYSAPYLSSSLQILIHSSLGIHSLLKRQSLKHNVIDRDKILVPSNWDSWGKIRIIREGFDMEGVSTAWSIEIQEPPGTSHSFEVDQPKSEHVPEVDDGSSAVAIFEQTIKNPSRDKTIRPPSSLRSGGRIDVETQDFQSFLAKQLEILEQLKVEDEKDRAAKRQLEMPPLNDNGHVNEHIGPVQFNMGGIQVDAEDLLQDIKEREASRTGKKESLTSSVDDGKAHNQALANFFAGLVKRPSGSARGSPTV